MASQRSQETPQQRLLRIEGDAVRHASQRLSQTNEQQEANLIARRIQRQQFMKIVWNSFRDIGFNYDPTIDYNNHSLLSIGHINKIFYVSIKTPSRKLELTNTVYVCFLACNIFHTNIYHPRTKDGYSASIYIIL